MLNRKYILLELGNLGLSAQVRLDPTKRGMEGTICES